MIKTMVNGLCMAVADSVPGVSGGTIAFILGFYDQFLDALHNVFSKNEEERKSSLIYLLKLGIGWSVGMIICVLLLSSLFSKNIYFMSSVFLGLTTVSIPFIISEEKKYLHDVLKNVIFTFVGAAIVIALSLLRNNTGVLGNIDFHNLTIPNLVYIFLSGMIAITAMVLPGISGSTILLIAGVYLPTINAIKDFLHFRFDQVSGLCALGFGILFGVALAIHIIRTALKKHRSSMVHLIIGLMVGSLWAIVMGPATLPEPVPPLSFETFSLPGFVIGIVMLIGLELLKKRQERKSIAGSH